MVDHLHSTDRRAPGRSLRTAPGEVLGSPRRSFEALLARRGVAWDATADEVFADVEAAERLLGR